MNSLKFRFASAAAFLLVAVLAFAAPANGQEIGEQKGDKSSSQQDRDTDAQTTTGLPTTAVLPADTTWKFGIKVTGTGDTRGAQVTVPVPIEWEGEQSIEIVSVDATENVKGAKVKKKGSDASQLFFKVPRLANGQVAEATVTVRITKHESKAPKDTDQFVFAKKPSGALRSYLSPSPYIESRDKKILKLAKELPIDEDAAAWEQVKFIYDWVRENIEYEFDTEIRSCLVALDKKQGDCEEMSSLFIAICRARGIPARAVWIPEHTYPEFYLEDADGKGHWFPCQAAGAFSFGEMPEAKPILQKGDKFKVKGHQRPLRYIQPTLKATGSQPQIQWIMQQVK